MSESVVKARILEVATDLFINQGYHLTGINQIIKESDIARASLYNHFKSKNELLIAYLEKTDERILSEINEFLSSFTDPREKLLALIDHRMQRQMKYGFKGCRFVKISLEISAEEEQKVVEITAAHKDRFKRLIGDLVAQANHKKILTDDLLTETVFLLLEGSTVSGALTRSPESLKKSREILKTLL